MEVNDEFFSQLVLDINNVKFNKKIFNAYNIQEVDQFLDDLICILSNNMEFTYKIKELENLVNRRNWSLSILGYNKKEVDEFFDDILERINI